LELKVFVNKLNNTEGLFKVLTVPIELASLQVLKKKLYWEECFNKDGGVCKQMKTPLGEYRSLNYLGRRRNKKIFTNILKKTCTSMVTCFRSIVTGNKRGKE
jgi:hypothetical protein